MEVELARKILQWWEDAQFWRNGDRNVFDEDPEFVKIAQKISPNFPIVICGNCHHCGYKYSSELSNEELTDD